MNKKQLFDNVFKRENDLFELFSRVENIICFFQKSIGQKNYEFEEVSLLQGNKICHIPQRNSSSNRKESFRKFGKIIVRKFWIIIHKK